MGRSGVRRVRAQFTWECVAADLADLYESIGPAREPVRATQPTRLRALPRRAPASHHGAHA
jgi:hypothetical protein